MTIHIHAPQIVYLLITLFGLGHSAVNHGKPRSAESFWTSLIASMLGFCLMYWGGFFGK